MKTQQMSWMSLTNCLEGRRGLGSRANAPEKPQFEWSRIIAASKTSKQRHHQLRTGHLLILQERGKQSEQTKPCEHLKPEVVTAISTLSSTGKSKSSGVMKLLPVLPIQWNHARKG